MNTKQKIEKALKDKGWIPKEIYWESVFYGGTGREGGWYIVIDDESCNDEVYEQITALENEVFQDGEFQGCAIVAYNSKTVFDIINRMPVFKPNTTKDAT
jgi:hypothetical protein